MTTTILIQMSPDELDARIAKALQTAGPAMPVSGIPIAKLPTLSAADTATVLDCSVKHLKTVWTNWPEHLRPLNTQADVLAIFGKDTTITLPGSSTRYATHQVLKVLELGLTYRKP